jgi:hypothetical protein
VLLYSKCLSQKLYQPGLILSFFAIQAILQYSNHLSGSNTIPGVRAAIMAFFILFCVSLKFSAMIEV